MGVTRVAGRAVDGLPRDALDGPVAVDEEAVAQGVAEPLHGGGHGPAVGQGHAPGAAEEGALRGERGGGWGVRVGRPETESQGTHGTPPPPPPPNPCPTLTAKKWKQRCRLALTRRAAAT